MVSSIRILLNGKKRWGRTSSWGNQTIWRSLTGHKLWSSTQTVIKGEFWHNSRQLRNDWINSENIYNPLSEGGRGQRAPSLVEQIAKNHGKSSFGKLDQRNLPLNYEHIGSNHTLGSACKLCVRPTPLTRYPCIRNSFIEAFVHKNRAWGLGAEVHRCGAVQAMQIMQKVRAHQAVKWATS